VKSTFIIPGFRGEEADICLSLRTSTASGGSGGDQSITQSCWTKAATNRSGKMSEPVGVHSVVGRTSLHGESQ
jgi:hypothetical protein